MAGDRPLIRSIASASATPADSVSSAVARSGAARARAGERTTETYKPEPGGENQLWPRRPLPAVCASAITTAPSPAGPAACDAATSLVDPIVGKKSGVADSGARRGATASSAAERSAGSVTGCIVTRERRARRDRRTQGAQLEVPGCKSVELCDLCGLCVPSLLVRLA